MNGIVLPDQSTLDWQFCRDALVEVSRTFSQPIRLLPPSQERALTVGYLLCRIADTVEDVTNLEFEQRDNHYSQFLRVLSGSASAESFSAGFRADGATDAEAMLVARFAAVMRVFQTLDSTARASIRRWVSEMTHGMRVYSQRSVGVNFHALNDLADLERYCYFVAGTVGHMITELFLEAIGPNAPRQQLYRHCESFGIGLQLVNIVKDVTDDHARGVCYLPRRLCEAEGFSPEQLLDPALRSAAKRVVGQVIDRAHEHLCAALEYTLHIPASHHQLRLFCLLPLWLALETLHLAREHDGVFTAGLPVKVSRADVQRIVVAAGTLCRDDAGLRRAIAALVETKPSDVALSANHEGWSAA